MEERSKLGASLSYRQGWEGRLDAVVAVLVSICAERPHELFPALRVASSKASGGENQIPIGAHLSLLDISKMDNDLVLKPLPISEYVLMSCLELGFGAGTFL
jgi:hypothetical protein